MCHLCSKPSLLVAMNWKEPQVKSSCANQMVLSVHFQIAAELDRSETARLLVEQGSHAGVRDINGLSALVLMITKMPSVVRKLHFH